MDALSYLRQLKFGTQLHFITGISISEFQKKSRQSSAQGQDEHRSSLAVLFFTWNINTELIFFKDNQVDIT